MDRERSQRKAQVRQMSVRQSRRGGQSGEIMLEAAIVFVPVLILLLALLSLGFWFYQISMMTNVASEIAAEVARNVKFENLGAYGDTLKTENASELRQYRSTFERGILEQKQNERGSAYGDWRIPVTSLGFGPQEPSVDVELHNSGIGRTYVKVTVSLETDFFLSGILKYTGILEDHPVFGGTAYAECVDLTEYTSMVNFLRYGSEKLAVFGPVGELYDKAKELLDVLGII